MGHDLNFTHLFLLQTITFSTFNFLMIVPKEMTVYKAISACIF